jgi:hypothetical protein
MLEQHATSTREVTMIHDVIAAQSGFEEAEVRS